MTGRFLSGRFAHADISDVVRELAAHLALGHQNRQPVSILDEYGGMSVDEAYLVQKRVVQHLVEFRGERTTGWKISCTGEEDRALIEAAEPLAGTLLESSILANGATLPLAGANGPLAEPELVLRLTRAPSYDATPEELADSVEVAAGLEIPHCRFLDWWPEGQLPNLTKEMLVADSAVAGRVVVGSEWHRLSVSEIESVECNLTLPDGSVRHGTAAAVFGSPLESLSWLLGKLHSSGQVLPEGSIVSSGTFTPPARVSAGTYVASFSLVGDVEATFVDDDVETARKEGHHDV